MKKHDIVISGYTCIDLIPEFKESDGVFEISDIFKPGKLIEIDGMDLVPGGVVPNTGVAMKRFNRSVFLNGLTGNDYMGGIIKQRLDKYNVAEGLKTAGDFGTAFSIVIAPPGIDRIFLESPGCNQIFDSTFINFDAISQSRIFHFGYPPLLRKFFINRGEELYKMYSRTKQMGVITSMDFSLPDPDSESGKTDWLAVLTNTFPLIDIFTPSLEEAVQIVFPDEYERLKSLYNVEIPEKIPENLIIDAGRKLIGMGVKIVFLTAGERGAWFFTGDLSGIDKKSELGLDLKEWNHRELWCSACSTERSKIKSASGAGDTANAALFSAILDRENPVTTLKYAAIAGRNSLYCNNIYDEIDNWNTMSAGLNPDPDSAPYVKEISKP